MATLDHKEIDGVTFVALHGNLTFEGLEKVSAEFEKITHQPGRRIVVDLTGIELITTPALSMFIGASHIAKASGGKLILTETTPPVRTVLDRLRLHKVLQLVEGVNNALAEARK
jgi:anti-anti-sigma factor